ncbi:MAG: hypothetical protein K2N65_05255 [Anaeroplasmataceae bacterium]|nr:hypothetical protein [Anaeroplasmataceae bacterium]
MAFQNRRAEHLNRKKLIVRDITNDSNGKLSSLIVDVERAEGEVSVEGTALTAETLNAEIRNIVQSMASTSPTAQTQAVYDSSNKVATTEFVWNVLNALGYGKLTSSSNDTGGTSIS